MSKNGMRPVHPGEILREELEELGMSAKAIARELGVPQNRISDILRGRRGNYCRHSTPTGSLSQYDTAIVAEPAKSL